jgi:hypothetical protein
MQFKKPCANGMLLMPTNSIASGPVPSWYCYCAVQAPLHVVQDMENDKRTVLSINNEGFKHYLVLKYLIEDENDKWHYLSQVPEDAIPSDVWYRLYQQLKEDVEASGGKVIAFESKGHELKSYENLKSDNWPEDWMWVIETTETKSD